MGGLVGGDFGRISESVGSRLLRPLYLRKSRKVSSRVELLEDDF